MAHQSSPPPSPPQPRRKRTFRNLLILAGLIALWVTYYETKTPTQNDTTTKTAGKTSAPTQKSTQASSQAQKSTEAQKSAQSDKPDLQAWEAAEVGDEVSIKYTSITYPCAIRDEADELFAVGEFTKRDAFRLGASAGQAVNKVLAAQKDAVGRLYSCYVPRSGVRYRVERKEFGYANFIKIVAYCLRPSDKDRCVWIVMAPEDLNPFENVQRTQPVATDTPTQTTGNAGPTEQTAAMPDLQQRFLSLVDDFATKYNRAPVDPLRVRRAKAICDLLAKPFKVEDWRGTVKPSSYHKGVLMVALNKISTVRTASGQPPDPDNTLLQPGTPLYDAAAQLSPEQEVIFSGEFLPADKDCIRENSLTTGISMTEPNWLFRFSSVKPAK